MKIKYKRFFIIDIDSQMYFAGLAGLGIAFVKEIKDSKKFKTFLDAENILNELRVKFDIQRKSIVMREIEMDITQIELPVLSNFRLN